MDDLISRQAAIKQILLCENHDMEHDFEFNQGLIVAMNAIEELPTAKPSTTLMKVEVGVDKESLRKAMEEAELTLIADAEKKGKWIDGQCSNCGCDVPAYIIDWKWQKDMNANYCPNCGARMEESDG